MKARYTRVVKQDNQITLSDFPGRVAWMIALPGCNYRCETCHNKRIAFGSNISTRPLWEEVSRIPKNINAVVLGGGEPLNNKHILGIIRYLRSKGFSVAIQTNGFETERLFRILPLVDHVSMDVKWPISIIDDKVTLTKKIDGLWHIVSFRTMNSINTIIKHFDQPDNCIPRGSYEFRTTAVPGITKEMLNEIATLLSDAGATTYYIQEYINPAGAEGNLAVSRKDAESVLAGRFVTAGVRWSS